MKLQNFEKNFSKFTKTKYCVGCANGSDALYIAIKSLNLKKDEEVIVPDMTWIATASAVINNNCKLRLVDVNIENGKYRSTLR
jgi:UDP-2-acetamido-2-deoxy-ribo-hexuluronate aminotransferase